MAASVGDRAQHLMARARSTRFPLAAPSWPTTVDRPDPERKVGLDYDHEWSRRYPVRLARAMVMDNVTRPLARVMAPATIRGLEHLRHVEGPVIFAANHASHIDTPLLLTTLPVEFRHRTIVAAASDYFFDRTWKSVLWSFSLAAIPIERSKVNRRSADTAAGFSYFYDFGNGLQRKLKRFLAQHSHLHDITIFCLTFIGFWHRYIVHKFAIKG